MIVFIAGATGAIGRPLVQQLSPPDMGDRHNSIGGEARTPPFRRCYRRRRRRPRQRLRRAIITASPHVVIDQLTDLAQPLRPGGFGDWLKGTVALRRDVTPALVDAARAAGASRVIAQSAAFMTAPEGPDIDDENAALYLDAPQPLTASITSNAELEAVVARSGT